VAEVTPPLFQTIDAEYDGSHLGLPYRDFIAEGVVGSSALAVTERGAGANMSVDVAAGVAWIKGDDSSASQPCYRVYNDATKNLTVTAADATNPRIDLVIAEVRDAAFSGVSTDWRLRVVAGTPAGSPSAPATPSNAIVLARLSVPALDTTIGTAQITDYRPRAGLAGADLGVPLVTSLPTQPYDGQVVDYLADSTNGVVWRFRYRAAEAGSYKWYFVGGPPMFNEVTANESMASTSYGNLGTTGPSLTVPLAGDYDVEIASRTHSGSASTSVYHSYAIGGTGASDNDAIDPYTSTSDGTSYASRIESRRRRKTALAASTALVSKYRTAAGTTTFWTNRSMKITPVRVG
jgi:hypothetical protein